jgi:hypothetical protein
MRRPSRLMALLMSTAAAALAPPAAASAEELVDLQLVLAVDVSRSMDQDEQQLQRDGYVGAFRHPDILNAIHSGPYGRIAVTYLQWAGAFYQEVLVPWRILESKEDAYAFADELAKVPLTQETRTSISGALNFAADVFRSSNAASERRTIDVSGDGSNNDGVPLVPVRDRVVASGIVINGLPILLRPSNLFGPLGTIPLDEYYRNCVIGGRGAFVIPILDKREFETAIRRKLVLEIAALPSYVIPVGDVPPSIDCALSERQRDFNDPFINP